MKISESSILFNSDRISIEEHQQRESLTVWKNGEDNRSTVTGNGKRDLESDAQKQLSILSESTKVSLSEQAVKSRSVASIEDPISDEKELMMDLNIRILRDMVQRITGKRIQLLSENSLQGTTATSTPQQGAAVSEVIPENTETASGAGLIYESYESHYEYEATSFNAVGTILTEDGQEINISVSLNMSREFFSEEQISIRAGDALKDPLVINFSGSAAELTQDTFSFDIDNDGRENQISFLQQGSGFLALDKNGDNRINNGSELFGPESGNGFQDLAAYDNDGNNWIDDNDSIYDKLRIWTKDSTGKDVLFALGEKGIGAIYLGSAATLFSMKTPENELLGQVQSTGIFLKEDGGVGTVQQIDLVA